MVEELIQQVRALPIKQQRAVSAYIGALVADAAAQPLHWVYKDDVMNEVLSSHSDDSIEFLPSPRNPFYTIPVGSQSSYGDQMLVISRSLVHSNGFNIDNYKKLFVETFGPETPHYNSYMIRETYTPGTVKATYPVTGPWMNRSMLRFIELCQTNKSLIDIISNSTSDDYNDPDIYARCIPFLLLYNGQDAVHDKIKEFTSLMQSCEVCLSVIGAVSRCIQLYINNGEINKGDNIKLLIDTISQSSDVQLQSTGPLIDDVMKCTMNTRDATRHFGLPGSFQSALTALKNESGYVSTIREVIKSGGCNCSRSFIVGSCLGAKYGIDSIPIEWIEKTLAGKEGLSLAIKIVQMSS